MAMVFYSLIHPKKHIPFVNDVNSHTWPMKWMFNSVWNPYLVKKRTPFLRFEGQRGELFNDLFERMLDFN